MTAPPEPKHPALRSVYWREEILELVLWLRGEGLDERLDIDVLCRFLGIDQQPAATHLERLTRQGYLRELPGGRYGLTAQGEEEGHRLIAGARSVPPSAPGGCGPECWCHTSPFEASECASYRAG